MTMQREDVERMEADLLRLAYECDEQGEGWEEDGPMLRDAVVALRTLLAERDATFAAGQEEMRERAAEAVRPDGYRTLYEDDALLERAKQAIRDLPIKPRP